MNNYKYKISDKVIYKINHSSGIGYYYTQGEIIEMKKNDVGYGSLYLLEFSKRAGAQMWVEESEIKIDVNYYRNLKINQIVEE